MSKPNIVFLMPDQLRADYDKALSLIPGKHRANLHAIYAETGDKKVERNELGPEHFTAWIDWAKQNGLGLDFNPSFFSHPKAADGFTLAHHDPGIRNFWIDHGVACRKIGAAMGAAQGSPCVTNFWVPDGYKDTPADRRRPRERLADSLDKMDRYSRLDLYSKLAQGTNVLAALAGEREEGLLSRCTFRLAFAMADWDAAMKLTNEW